MTLEQLQWSTFLAFSLVGPIPLALLQAMALGTDWRARNLLRQLFLSAWWVVPLVMGLAVWANQAISHESYPLLKGNTTSDALQMVGVLLCLCGNGIGLLTARLLPRDVERVPERE